MNPSRESLNLAGSFVAAGLVVILGFITWALVFHEVPKANENGLLLLIGILSANVGVVVGFFFGSSVTAKKQAETIATLASTAQVAGAALAGPTDSIVLKPGEQATSTATPAGTVIDKSTPGETP